MRSWLKKALALLPAARQRRAAMLAQQQAATQRQQVRLVRALALQVPAATTVRQLAQLQALAASWVPPGPRQALEQLLQARLLALPIPMPGCKTSSASSRKTARSTSKRRRGR